MSDIRMLWLLLLLLGGHLILVIVQPILPNHLLLPVFNSCLSFFRTVMAIPQLVLLELLHQLFVGEVNPVEVVRLLVVGVGVVQLDQLDILLPHAALAGSLGQVQGQEVLGILTGPPPLLPRLRVDQPSTVRPQAVSGSHLQQQDDI